MRIRGVSIPAAVTHLFCFLSGTLLVLPWDTPCEMNLEGILISPSTSLARRLESYDERAPLFLLTKDGQQTCRVSDLPFFVWRDPAGQGLYLHLEKSAGASKIIDTLLSRRPYEISARGANYANCLPTAQVIYGS